MGAVMQTYERALLEATNDGVTRVLRIFPVDGGAILDEDGRRLPCWNALSAEQRRGLIESGGTVRVAEAHGLQCDQPAAVLIEAPLDEDSPGPRFYCYGCGARRLTVLASVAESEARS